MSSLLSSALGTGFPGTRYSSFTHFPRSISLQRSEQNGRWGLSCQGTGLLQVGHCFIKAELRRDRDFFYVVQKPFRPLHQKSTVNEIDRTLPSHRVQANGNALARGSND